MTRSLHPAPRTGAVALVAALRLAAAVPGSAATPVGGGSAVPDEGVPIGRAILLALAGGAGLVAYRRRTVT